MWERYCRVGGFSRKQKAESLSKVSDNRIHSFVDSRSASIFPNQQRALRSPPPTCSLTSTSSTMSLAHHTAHVTKPCSQTRGASVAGWKSMPASPRFGRANPIQSASYVHVAKEASHVTKATATTAPQAVKIDEFDLNAR